MDRDWGSKPGGGGAASAQNEAIDRRERLRRLALETIDLAKDPYFMRNHLGRYILQFFLFFCFPYKPLAFVWLPGTLRKKEEEKKKCDGLILIFGDFFSWNLKTCSFEFSYQRNKLRNSNFWFM